MKQLTIISAALLMLSACGTSESNNSYTVNIAADSTLNGQTAFLTNFDTGEKIDSTVITDGVAPFNGSIDTTLSARAIINGKRSRVFILEPGNIVVDSVATGTPLNDELTTINRAGKELLGHDDAKFNAMLDTAISNNADNALGQYLFLDYKAYESDMASLKAALEKTPSLKKSTRINKLLKALELKEETSVGKLFKDFEITYEGTTKRLSDYVGKGKYTLVDFWASWCGPCIRETAVLKQLNELYSGKGLQILGVAVWDEPENTLTAIEQHKLPWEQIINAQTIPTDIYGISSIPCIILFDPDGNIVSRDKQGQELIDDVAAVMNN